MPLKIDITALFFAFILPFLYLLFEVYSTILYYL